jgi:hypothetical protein
MVIFARALTIFFPLGSLTQHMAFLFSSFDESADKHREHVFVVAGWLGYQSEWWDIESKWVRRLEREDNPDPMKYYSDKEWRSLTGQFARFRDPNKYPRPKGRDAANKIRDDLSAILRTSPIAGFGLGILLKDYRAVRRSTRARKVLPSDPYIQAYQQIMVLVAAKLQEEKPSDWVAFLCDKHDKSADVKALYSEFKKMNPICGTCMGSLNYMEDEESPALQAADLLAGICKDDFLERITKPDATRARDDLKQRFGGRIEMSYWNKTFMELLVNANLLRQGKPSIGSTQQLTLYADLLTRGSIATKSDFDNFSEETKAPLGGSQNRNRQDTQGIGTEKNRKHRPK